MADCERRVHDLLCDMPDYQITLDRFMGEYEKKYGHKMSYYGHSRLTNLMESFSSTITVRSDAASVFVVHVYCIHVCFDRSLVYLSLCECFGLTMWSCLGSSVGRESVLCRVSYLKKGTALPWVCDVSKS